MEGIDNTVMHGRQSPRPEEEPNISDIRKKLEEARGAHVRLLKEAEEMLTAIQKAEEMLDQLDTKPHTFAEDTPAGPSATGEGIETPHSPAGTQEAQSTTEHPSSIERTPTLNDMRMPDNFDLGTARLVILDEKLPNGVYNMSIAHALKHIIAIYANKGYYLPDKRFLEYWQQRPISSIFEVGSDTFPSKPYGPSRERNLDNTTLPGTLDDGSTIVWLLPGDLTDLDETKGHRITNFTGIRSGRINIDKNNYSIDKILGGGVFTQIFLLKAPDQNEHS